MELPPSIQTHLVQWFVRHHTVAYLLLDGQGQVDAWGGAVAAMGIGPLAAGQPASDQLPCLVGTLPLGEDALWLPLVKTPTGAVVDVHLFRIDPGYGILLVDRSTQARRLARLQQKANDLALTRGPSAR